MTAHKPLRRRVKKNATCTAVAAHGWAWMGRSRTPSDPTTYSPTQITALRSCRRKAPKNSSREMTSPEAISNSQRLTKTQRQRLQEASASTASARASQPASVRTLCGADRHDVCGAAIEARARRSHTKWSATDGRRGRPEGISRSASPQRPRRTSHPSSCSLPLWKY